LQCCYGTHSHHLLCCYGTHSHHLLCILHVSFSYLRTISYLGTNWTVSRPGHFTPRTEPTTPFEQETHWVSVELGPFSFLFFLCDATAPLGHRPPHCPCFNIAHRHITLCRAYLEERSSRRRNLYLKTYDRLPCRRRDSKRQSKQVSDHRSTS